LVGRVETRGLARTVTLYEFSAEAPVIALAALSVSVPVPPLPTL